MMFTEARAALPDGSEAPANEVGVFAFFRLPETRGVEARRRAHARVDWSNFLDALHHPSIGRLLATTFLSTLAFVAMEATLPRSSARPASASARAGWASCSPTSGW